MNRLVVEAAEPEKGFVAVLFRVLGATPQPGNVLQLSGSNLKWRYSGAGIISRNADPNLIAAVIVGIDHQEVPEEGSLLEIIG
jgi:hypothetical protein